MNLRTTELSLSGPPRLRDALAPKVWKLGLVFGALQFLVLGVGIGVVLCRSPTPSTPHVTPDPAYRGDLADYRAGARVTVSSYHSGGRHHPIYAIDGRRRATGTEKWTSASDDRAPWLTLHLPRPTHIRAVEIAHAGIVEHAIYTIDAYDITCLSPSGAATGELAVRGAKGRVTIHELDCPDTSELVFYFHTGPTGSPTAVVRIYEIDVRPKR